MSSFLIVRPDDLVVLGVHWSGFQPTTAVEPGAPVVLQAQSDEARVVLIFPPQAIAEQKYTNFGDIARRGARLAAPSRVEFRMQAGTLLPLDVQGILAALAGSATLVPGAIGDERTAIELPWGLIVSARARSAAAGVVSDHSASPVASPSGTLGLWRARLRSGNAGAGAADARLALLPLRVNLDDPNLDTSPLSFDDRQRILIESESGDLLAEVTRLELSALGGSFSARAIWPTFEWDHDATLGRDQRVRVLAKGVLYPFGHRAEFQELIERIFDPPGAQSVAGLHRTSLLVITEPVRVAVEDSGLARQFPFSEVEILTRSFADVVESEPKRYPRKSFRLQEKQEELGIRRQELSDVGVQVNEVLLTIPAPEDIDGFANSPFATDEVRRLLDARAIILDRSTLIAEGEAAQQAVSKAQDQIDALNDEIAKLQGMPFGPDGFPDPGVQAQIDELEQQIADIQANLPVVPSPQLMARWRAERNQALADEAALLPTVHNQLANLPRDVDALALFKDQSAKRFVELRDTIIPKIEGDIFKIEQIEGAPENQVAVYFWPAGSGGTRLQFPLRCRGGLGDTFFSMPLIFVRDITRPEDLDLGFFGFVSLANDQVDLDLEAAWGSQEAEPVSTEEAILVTGEEFDVRHTLNLTVPGARNVRLPGVSIDMLRSANRLASDVQEVHALSIAAIKRAGRFRPVLKQFQAELPALRSLIPGHSGRVPLSFTGDFLALGDAVDVPFNLVNEVLVDFTDRADRSGGLISPRFVADVISRKFGPVATGALPGVSPPDLSSVYAGARLFGFSLAELIKPVGLEAPPLPPIITQLLENGKPPGVCMEWKDLKLKSFKAFRASDSTRLTLTVEASLEKSETTCTLSDFSLVLPPSGPELLILGFRSVVFTQHAGRAPDLQVNGLKVDFAGALKLLRDLQTQLLGALGLGGNQPTIHASASGITASYAFSFPSVPAGVFLLRNIAVRIGVDVPFVKKPVTVSLAFASRENPFNLTVLMLGGGGYIDLQVGGEGLTRLEASLEFGAMVAVDFVIAKGEVHALGGVHFLKEPDGSLSLEAFIRIGGSLEVLGLISVSVELLVALTYDSDRNRLFGRATLVIEVNLTLFAESVSLDSGEWELIGSDVPEERLAARPVFISLEEDPGLEVWRSYRRAFVEETQI